MLWRDDMDRTQHTTKSMMQGGHRDQEHKQSVDVPNMSKPLNILMTSARTLMRTSVALDSGRRADPDARPFGSSLPQRSTAAVRAHSSPVLVRPSSRVDARGIVSREARIAAIRAKAQSNAASARNRVLRKVEEAKTSAATAGATARSWL